ncbi:hypothetical protein ACHAWF_013036 [Thalassiosira exigua]
MDAENNSTQSAVECPALPPLYFPDSNDEPGAGAAAADERSPSLRTLPPELLHSCLAKYADWGDLAKLACVRSEWKNSVEDAADYGGRDAAWELSMCLLHGDGDGGEKEANERNSKGLRRNERLAVKYLTRLSGVEVDETLLAQSSECGEGHEAKSALPGDWECDKTAAAGADEAALFQLAACYLDGVGVPAPCPARAVHYLRAAYHRTKSVRSAHKLALLYEYPVQSNGLVPVDVVAAFEWFKAAAEGGHVPSMAELALCYELGCGVAQSDEEALEWYTKAARAGHSASHYSVGEHFEEARGVRMDHEEACLWYYRAVVLGDEDGVGGLRRLEDVARRVVPEADGILNA